VDDIFILYNQNKTNEQQICNRLKKIDKNLQTKLNTEDEDRIQFLDLPIHRNKHNMTINIYRKPTETNTTIHYLSNHPSEHKMAAYRYHINRLNTLPINKEGKEKEWDNKGRMAVNNGFPKDSIKKLRKKLEQKSIGTNDRKQKKQKWTPFTYFSPLVRNVTNIFRDTDINIAYRSTNTIFKQLAKKPDRPDNPSGIYSIRYRIVPHTRSMWDNPVEIYK